MLARSCRSAGNIVRCRTLCSVSELTRQSLSMMQNEQGARMREVKSFLANLARPARAAFAAAHRHAGAAAVPARQGAGRRQRDPARRAAAQRSDPPRRFLGAGVSRRDAGGDAAAADRALRQPDRRAAHARRRHVLLYRRASRRCSSPTKSSISARSSRDHATAGISSSAAPPGSAWRRWPRPRPTAWCAGLAACAGGGCIRSIYAIALLALIHYFQQTKADVTVPTFAAGLFGG